jgi:hypothetical protein
MRRLALALFVAAASCGSSLGDPNQPDPPDQPDPRDIKTPAYPDWSPADCTMYNPTVCRLDVAKTSVGIDVHYPNTSFCGLQLLPADDLLNPAAFTTLASSWQVRMMGSSEQVVLTPDTSLGVLEYPLGTELLYLTRVKFTSTTSDTLASLIGTALGPDVSLFAVPVECPGRRASQ